MKNKIINRVGTRIDASSAEVWEALTNPELIKEYFFGTNTISEWRAGSPIVFEGVWNGKSYRDKGTIIDIQPFKLLKYNYWSSMSGIEDKPENYANITYEISEEGDETILTITQDNIPDEKMRAHSEENWKKVLANLKDLLENKMVPQHYN
ncbi:MAG TPA: SRPBCC family protein [Puia sp.]|nr:SRPBCC family protein [Puia sp.]